MGPVIKELKKYPTFFEVKVCITGQHRSMLSQATDWMEIIPDYNLNIMKDGQDLFDVTTSIILGMRDLLKSFCPDLVLVHGDTSTCFAASLASYYSGNPVAHIEAGLRTYNLGAPFPEEFNRQIVGKIATIHFAPTQNAKLNLLNEGILEDRICVSGNTVVDALIWTCNKINNNKKIKEEIESYFKFELGDNFQSKRIILITGHRRENFGLGIQQIAMAVKVLSHRFPNDLFVYPVHLNPNILEPIKTMLENISNVKLINPLSYEKFSFLMQNSSLILTDSGGIQEEAPSLGKQVLVMRDETERPEAVEAGNVILVGSDSEKIINITSSFLDNSDLRKPLDTHLNPYGSGQSSIKIVEFIKNYLKL